MKKIITFILCLIVLSSCYNPDLCNENGTLNVGYTSKGGVLILNSGIESESSITFISPNGSIETNIFAKKNNKPLCYDATDMYFFNNDIYVIAKGKFRESAELIVINASDMREKERYSFNNLHFKLPDGVNPDQQKDYIFSPDKICVLDRSNVLIQDHQAVFRLDLNANPIFLNIIEGTYRISNHGSGIDTSISSNGSVVVDDKLYLVVGGWTPATDDAHIGIYEFSKNKNKVNSKIGLISQGTVSGITPMDKSEMLCIAIRGKKTFMAQLDARNLSNNGRVWKVADKISSNFLSSTSAFYLNKNLYYLSFYGNQPISIKKFDFSTKKVDELSSFATDDNRIKRLTTGITFDDKSRSRFFISGTDDFAKITTASGHVLFKPSVNVLLEYKINEDGSVKLKNKIDNKTSYPVKFLFF